MYVLKVTSWRIEISFEKLAEGTFDTIYYIILSCPKEMGSPNRSSVFMSFPTCKIT